MKRLVIVVIVFSFVSASALFAQEKGMKRPAKLSDSLPDELVYRTGWALVIGVNQYSYLPPKFQLSYAVSDAEAFADLLQRKFGFEKGNIIILRDKEATKQKIMEKLYSLADNTKVKDEDCVVVYFSGHGQTVPLPRGGDMGFLIPHDAKVDLSEEPNLAQYKQYCIGMNELNEAAKTIPAKHRLFIIDACYSGLVLRAGRGLSSKIPGYLKKVAKAPAQQMITAGGKGEESEERPDLGHGVFTYKLLRGLEDGIADENDDGVVTGTELASYLNSAVLEATDGKQTPQFGREDEGEFLFIPQTFEGKLQVQVSPADAVVRAIPAGEAGKKSSFAISSGEATLPAGTYSITAERDGYEPAVKDRVEIAENTTTRLTLTLKPRLATIVAGELTRDVRVFINGSPVTLPHQLQPGTYKIRMERDGYQPDERSETLSPGQVLSLGPQRWVPVAPQPPSIDVGTLQVRVDPADAKVTIVPLGSSRGFTLPPTGEIDLPAGIYSVTVEKDGYESLTRDRVEVKSDAPTRLSLTLKSKKQAAATITASDLLRDTKVIVNGIPVALPCQLPPGVYMIRLERDGFRPVEVSKTLTSGEVFSLSPQWIPLQRGVPGVVAFSASMVVPGLGQHLQGKSMRALFYEALIASLSIVAVGAVIHHNNTLNEYLDIQDQIRTEASGQMDATPELLTLLDEQKSYYDKAKSARALAIATQFILGAVWGVNALDAGVLTKPAPRGIGVVYYGKPESNGEILLVSRRF